MRRQEINRYGTDDVGSCLWCALRSTFGFVQAFLCNRRFYNLLLFHSPKYRVLSIPPIFEPARPISF